MSKSTNQKKPAEIDWHSADIVAALRKRGWSLTQLSLTHGYTNRSAIGQALYKPYPKAEEIIAKTLGVKPWEIWPSRYGSDHKPNRKRGGKPMRGHMPATTASNSSAARGKHNLQAAVG